MELAGVCRRLPSLRRRLRPDLYILRLSAVYFWPGGLGTRPRASSSCVCGGERGEGDLACFPSISEEAEAIDGDEGARCGDEGEGGGLEAADVPRAQGVGSGLEGGTEVRGLSTAMGASACGPLCRASKSRTGPMTKAEGATGATGPFAGVSRSGEGAGADAGSRCQGADVLTNLSRFDARELLTTSRIKMNMTRLTRAKG